MNHDSHNESKVERVADDVWFRLAARASMLILGFVGLPMIIYIGGGALNTIEALKKEQIATTISLRVLEVTIQSQMTDRYKGDDARRDFLIRDLQIKALENSVGKLDRAIEKIQDQKK